MKKRIPSEEKSQELWLKAENTWKLLVRYDWRREICNEGKEGSKPVSTEEQRKGPQSGWLKLVQENNSERATACDFVVLVPSVSFLLSSWFSVLGMELRALNMPHL